MGAPSRPFPWREAMAFGLGVLRWTPAQFWAATPRELAAAGGWRAGPPAPGQPALEDLLARFPDVPRTP